MTAEQERYFKSFLDHMFDHILDLEERALHHVGADDPSVRELLVLELPMRFECREGCPGSEELQAWNENNPVSSNDAGASTQHPFEALRSLLEPRE